MNNKNNRITLRLDDVHFQFLVSVSNEIGVTPSELLRLLIRTSLAQYNKLEKKEKEVAGPREDEQSNIDCQLQ